MKIVRYAFLKFVFFLSPILFSSFNPDVSESDGEANQTESIKESHYTA